MTVPVRWFRDILWGRNLWYMDCPRVPDFLSKRRVALVVDTTDSCWAGACAPWIRGVLEELDRRLEPDDLCTFWRLGPRDPEFELLRGPHPQQLATRILSHPHLRPYEQGSWLGDTVAGIDAWSRGAAAGECEDYLLILTDGEIHDGGVVALPPAIPPERIAMILPTLAPGAPRQPVTTHEPGAWARVQTPWSGSLALLGRTQSPIRLLPGVGDHEVYRYDDQESIDRVVGTLLVQPRARLKLCFIGDQQPAPAFLVGADTVSLAPSSGTLQNGCPTDAQALQMHRIVELLLAPWDRNALAGLLKPHSIEVAHCGLPQVVDRSRPPSEQPCSECRGCLLVKQEAFPIGADDQDKALLFPLSPDGTIADTLPQYRSASAVSEPCYGVHADAAGQPSLVLNFLPTVL